MSPTDVPKSLEEELGLHLVDQTERQPRDHDGHDIEMPILQDGPCRSALFTAALGDVDELRELLFRVNRFRRLALMDPFRAMGPEVFWQEDRSGAVAGLIAFCSYVQITDELFQCQLDAAVDNAGREVEIQKAKHEAMMIAAQKLGVAVQGGSPLVRPAGTIPGLAGGM